MMKNGKGSIYKPILYLKNISKTFGTTRALNNVTLKILHGEIHGLLGQNGCGKSTLIKILAGFHEPDEGGELFINGTRVGLPLAPGEFKEYGISFVHQDLGLVPNLTVLENWTLGEIAYSPSLKINWKEKKRKMQQVFSNYEFSIDFDATIINLSPVEKAMLAILRAVEDIKSNSFVIENKCGLLVLDEPTVFLPRTAVDILFKLVRKIASEGIGIIFVSHDLDEVKELTDSFTVLRDGYNVGDGKTNELTKDEIIKMILGEELVLYQSKDKKNINKQQDKESMYIKNLKGNIVVSESFEIKKGEVLGITGLAGSGFEEIPLLLFGANQPQNEGYLQINTKKINLKDFNPQKAVRSKMALIPADRLNAGAIASLSIEDNMMMQSLHRYNPMKIRMKAMREKSMQLVSEYEVYPNNVETNLGQLSGGNQQKVILAKWIQENPDLLILHEPTQGVDIGARQQIYRIIEHAVKQNHTSVVCCSSAYEELEQICDRVLIMVKGRIIKELVGKEITKENITKLCYETA